MSEQFSTIVLLVAAEARGVVVADAPIEERFRAAMSAVQSHWMATNPEDQFMGAVAAVWELADSSERERIEAELRQLNTLAAVLRGVPVDFEAIEPLDDPIGIRRIWQEVEHLTDPPDMADTYVLLDDGEVRVVGCEQCFQVPCRCADERAYFEAAYAERYRRP